MTQPETLRGLDDPDYARFAWARFRRVLGWVGLVAALSAVLAVYLLDRSYGPLGWVGTLATVGGVVATVMMAGALMGLVFLSSGSGHDEAVEDFDPDRIQGSRRK